MIKIVHVIQAALELTGYTRAYLLGETRSREVVRARHLAMAICRNELGRSYGQIAIAFNRDHSTVIHGHRMADYRRTKLPDDAEMYALLLMRAGDIAEAAAATFAGQEQGDLVLAGG
jgi:chromosomal replication initiation ATPase DnaA